MDTEIATETQPDQAGDAGTVLPPDPAVAALVKRWTARIQKAEKIHADAFKRMRDDQKFAANYKGAQWGGAKNKYVANLTFRHVQQTVATLYAKNPRVKATRRKRREFAVWDEDQMTLLNAQQGIAAQSPESMKFLGILQDAMEGMKHIRQMNGLGETMEILYHYEMDSHVPSFKLRMKQMIRRAVTCGVGYVVQTFQRSMQKDPATIFALADATRRLAFIQQKQQAAADGDALEDSADVAELKATIETLQKSIESNDVIAQERLMWSFPRSTSIVVDPRCTSLTEFDGAHWLATKFFFAPDEVKQIFDVDVSRSFTAYRSDGIPIKDQDESFSKAKGPALDTDMACVWGVMDKDTGTEFYICDGYKGYLRPPTEPVVKLERFYNVYTFVPNQDENEFDLFPPSDVQLIKEAQKEFNRSRDGLREHRRINRPFTITRKGALNAEDKEKLKNREPFEIVELEAIEQGVTVDQLLQQFKGAPIDPNMYDVGQIFDDIQKTVGAQEANFGGTSGATATESSIAETSRVSSMDSKIDDLNDMLSMMARDGGVVLMRNVSKETAIRIAGPGAIWPESPNDDTIDLIGLEVVAGSSGRPNKAIEIANLERVAPFLLQLPGLSPEWLARVFIERLDDKLDITEGLAANVPSVIAQNGMAGKVGPPQAQGAAGGDASKNPAAQGPQGGANAPAGPAAPGGPQPAMPSGGAPPAAPGMA